MLFYVPEYSCETVKILLVKCMLLTFTYTTHIFAAVLQLEGISFSEAQSVYLEYFLNCNTIVGYA